MFDLIINYSRNQINNSTKHSLVHNENNNIYIIYIL